MMGVQRKQVHMAQQRVMEGAKPLAKVRKIRLRKFKYLSCHPPILHYRFYGLCRF
jgi:hypothetical protein